MLTGLGRLATAVRGKCRSRWSVVVTVPALVISSRAASPPRFLRVGHGLCRMGKRLERARSEVATTRALANAARMIAEQPALLQLRTLQAVEAGGATVVLTQGTAAGPVPGTPPQD
jgi:hypothetical protein